MPCARGCCETQAEHYRSLRILDPNRRALTKTTTADDRSQAIDTTEHWHERQDVMVRLKEPVRLRGDRTTGRVENI